jgi:hypothetical protein
MTALPRGFRCLRAWLRLGFMRIFQQSQSRHVLSPKGIHFLDSATALEHLAEWNLGDIQ